MVAIMRSDFGTADQVSYPEQRVITTPLQSEVETNTLEIRQHKLMRPVVISDIRKED